MLLGPLADLQRTLVLRSDVLWTDDTHVTVLSGRVPGSVKARFWAYIGGDAAPYSVYDFTMSRARDGPASFLEGYRGFLHADAYGGYDGIYTGSDGTIIEVACWSHARRKFYDARANAPREANRVLEWIRQLYDVEDRARDLTAEARQAMRERESVPILDRIEAYLDELSPRVLPKSALGKALTYARNQRAALRRYVTDGRLTIDNNVSERTLRLQAIGRKNWLFLGSEAAGPRAAVLFTILAGAKRHRLEPWAYLRDVLLRLERRGDGPGGVAAGPLGGGPSGARAGAPPRRVAAEGGAAEGGPHATPRGPIAAGLSVGEDTARGAPLAGGRGRRPGLGGRRSRSARDAARGDRRRVEPGAERTDEASPQPAACRSPGGAAVARGWEGTALTVIRGDPGSGKSSLIRYLALRWAGIAEPTVRDTQPIPLVIDLGELRPLAVRRTLRDSSGSWRKPPSGTNGPAACWIGCSRNPDGEVLLLDGLDEIFDKPS